jgi:hypothetical protein
MWRRWAVVFYLQGSASRKTADLAHRYRAKRAHVIVLTVAGLLGTLLVG